MGKGRIRAGLVGAATIVLVALAVGGLITRPLASGTPRQTPPTTTIATPTTCLPVAEPSVPPPSSRVVEIDHPGVIAVTATDNGTEYDVPIGSTFNVELRGSIAGGCERRTWEAPTAEPREVLAPVGIDATLGQLATASFEAVGPGLATISSRFEDCTPECSTTPWSVSVRVASATPSSLPRTR